MSDKIYDKSSANPDGWNELATKQLKGKSPEEALAMTREKFEGEFEVLAIIKLILRVLELLGIDIGIDLETSS